MLRVPGDAPQWAVSLAQAIQRLFDNLFTKPVPLPGYSVNGLPDPAAHYSAVVGKRKSAMIYVHDESGGGVPAFTDGTNWRRCTDRTVVS